VKPARASIIDQRRTLLVPIRVSAPCTDETELRLPTAAELASRTSL
jgi:hypothetical protein